jgi:hypothetical protein
MITVSIFLYYFIIEIARMAKTVAQRAAAAGGAGRAAGDGDWPWWLEAIGWVVAALIGGLLSALGGMAGVRVYNVCFTTTFFFAYSERPLFQTVFSERPGDRLAAVGGGGRARRRGGAGREEEAVGGGGGGGGGGGDWRDRPRKKLF